MFRLVALLACGAILSTGAMAASLDNLPSVDKLPAGYGILDEVVPTLGQPYAPKVGDKPTRVLYPGAPVYFVYKGKVIGTAIELDHTQLDQGLSFENLPVPDWLPPINHIDIIQKNQGSRLLGPSMSVRLWFIPSEDLDKIQF